ncbi:MAG: diguanylate cyclase, partial [Candidatus Edwardsbacteria bacterium]|nr:diguanylate cyclase [Candidatus Edwardsbacteria bacterium]
ILVTGLGRIEDRVKGLEAGADDFLSKPFNLDELLVRVRSLVKLKKLQDRMIQMEQEPQQAPPLTKIAQRPVPVIMVVEDDEKIVRICKSVLSTGGYEIVSAGDAGEAIQMIERDASGLIILDLMLPGMDGLELLSMLKGNPLTAGVPVIILTALADLKTKVKGFYIGADDYLVKPVSSLELLARVRANIRKHAIERQLKSQRDEAFQQSVTDPLTGLYNRRYMDSVMERELTLHKRSGRPLTVLMIDIDKFKKINDAFGHSAGDETLKAFSSVLRQELRSSDLTVRMGGDEFFVVRPDTGMEQATAIAGRLRSAAGALAIAALRGDRPTVSIGAYQAGTDDAGLVTILKKADEALYLAKQGGRNRVAKAA